MLFLGVIKDPSHEMASKIEAIAVHAYKQYSTADTAYEVYPDAIQFLHYLEAKRRPHWYEPPKIKLGIISNFDKRIVDLVDQLEFSPYIDFIAYSEESRCSKPGKEIFEDAMIKSNLKNLKSDEILHIGDDFKKDYLGAKNVGWNALLIQRNKEAKNELLSLNSVKTNFGEAQIVDDICDNFYDVEAKISNAF